MKLGDLLGAKTVAAGLPALAKPAAIERLVDLLTKSGALSAPLRSPVLEALLAREREMTTGIGQGIALPHARIPRLPKMLAAFATCPAGIDFQSLDGEKATILVLLLAPEDKRQEHVRTLSEVSRLLGDEATRRSFLDAKSDEDLWQAIQDAERKALEAR